MVLGNLYVSASKSCGNTFQQSTVYWVAVDAFRMALNYEETAEDANKRINTYSRYFPTKTDCFSNTTPKFKEKYNLPENYIISAGDTYTVECWINKSTTVRLSPETN